jgi:hypothetical protein
MNRDYTPPNTLQNYVSRMTLDKNKGVYLSDTNQPTNSPSIFSNISVVVIIVICIIFILAYFNINLFTIIGNIIQRISNIITPIVLNILHYFGIALGTTVATTTSVASSGISDVTTSINTTNKAVSGTIISGIQGNGVNESAYPAKTIQNSNEKSFHIVNTAPQIAAQQQKDDEKQYVNSVQYNTPVGYCFIGQQKNQRYCSEISEAHQCASGDVFPTMDMCINPNLRVS